MKIENYVSFELAKRLKACGFNEPCNTYYYYAYGDENEDEFMESSNADDYNSDEWTSPHFSAPTLDRAVRWLRTVHGLHICISAVMGGRWTYEIQDLKPIYDDSGDTYSRVPERDGYPVFDTYKKALSFGIEVVLDAISEWHRIDDNQEKP